MVDFLSVNWPAPLNVKAVTTLRNMWGQTHADMQSRKQLSQALHLPDEPIWLSQIHSNRVIPASQLNRGQEADASYTDEAKRVCVILTADCLPILICNKAGTHIAAIHAGWRGLANGILENTFTALDQPPTELIVWLGPAIGPQKFEVGSDVYEAFTATTPNAIQAFNPIGKNKWLANLYALATLKLNAYGVTAIYGGHYCTYTQQDLFFSYRRENSKTGRMATLIWRES